MKLLCLLLSVYVLLLSAKPCCADSDCTQQSVRTEKVPADDACPDCPPFSVCSASISFIFNGATVIQLPPNTETALKHISIYKQPALQQIALAIWQPPKLG